MPTNRKRTYTSPSEKALVALGLDPDLDGEVTSAALAGAIARYADLMYEATADLDRVWRRTHWGFVAECLRATVFPVLTPADYPAHLAVVQAIERAHDDRRLGDMWFLDAIEGATLTLNAAMQRSDARVKAVCDQLRGMTAVHGAAVLAAVRWYWKHAADLDGTQQEWWLPSARNKQFNARPAKPKPTKGKKKTKSGGATLFDEDGGE